ncbi:translation initiation factor eIF3 subunit g [Irineochytrium annulatum]|nr:translation initiation factor eIF3 subunit g [Irineochytrium annulatum]
MGPSSRVEPDGTKIVVEYRTNDDGKRVKVTSKIRTTVRKTIVNEAVARRKKLTKFGESRGLPQGIDSDSTSFGEKQEVKFVAGKFIDAPAVQDVKPKLGASASKIICRICKGDHWTTKCPFKDSHVPMDSGADKPAGTGFMDDAAAAKTAGGRYVPPGMRGGARTEGSAPPGTRPRDDLSTLRITNLSEETTETDVKDLVSRVSLTFDVKFVARDRDTNMCKGFAFVSFYSKDDADRAMQALNGYGYDNLILHVEFAKNKERE